MKFKKIILENIRSYERQEIDFPNGSVLLSGEVGSGKSSILLAIEYALFGLQPGQKGSSLLRNGSDSGKVIMELEIDEQKIVIERGLVRSSKSVVNDYAAININGKKEQYSITELKTKVLNLLGYPQEFIKKTNLLYRYTVYTPQEQMKQIILEDSEVRLNIIRHIFGIDKYKKIRENLLLLLGKLKEEGKVLQGEIKSLNEDNNRLASTKSFLNVLIEKISDKEGELKNDVENRKKVEIESLGLEEKIKEKLRFENEVEKATILINTKRDSSSSIAKEIIELRKNEDNLEESFNESTYKEVVGKIKIKGEEIEKLNFDFIDISGQIKSIEKEEIGELEKKNRIFQIDICPTCLQDVPEAHKHNILNETEKKLADIKNKKEVLRLRSGELRANLDKSREERVMLEEHKLKLEVLKSKIEYIERGKIRALEMQKQKDNLEKDISLLSKHIMSLKEAILKFSKFDNLYRIKQEELKEAFKIEKNSEIGLAELRKEKEMTSREILGLEEIIKKKEESKTRLNRLLEIMDWLSNGFSSLVEYVERSVLRKVRQEFSGLFSKWFYMLAGDSFDVQLDENFTPLVVQNDIEMDYAFLSGGERTSVALAYRLALNQTINSVLSKIKTKEIVVLDEPTEGFSESQINIMRNLFIELNAEQLIIVSHEPKIESFVDHVIRLKKDDNVSHFEG